MAKLQNIFIKWHEELAIIVPKMTDNEKWNTFH
jgi:hypothetical protein